MEKPTKDEADRSGGGWIRPAPGDDEAGRFYREMAELGSDGVPAPFLECIVRLPFVVPVENVTQATTMYSWSGGRTDDLIPVLRRYRRVLGDRATAVPASVARVVGGRMQVEPQDAGDLLFERWLDVPRAESADLVEYIVEVSLPGDPSTDLTRIMEVVCEVISDDLMVASELGAPTPVRSITTGDIAWAVPVTYFDLSTDPETRRLRVVHPPFSAARLWSAVPVASTRQLSAVAARRDGLTPVARNVIRFLDHSRSLIDVGWYAEAVIAVQTSFEVLIYGLGQTLKVDLGKSLFKKRSGLADHLLKFREILDEKASDGWPMTQDEHNAPEPKPAPEDARLEHFRVCCTRPRNRYVHGGEPITRGAAVSARESVVPAMGFLIDRFGGTYPATRRLLDELAELLPTR